MRLTDNAVKNLLEMIAPYANSLGTIIERLSMTKTMHPVNVSCLSFFTPHPVQSLLKNRDCTVWHSKQGDLMSRSGVGCKSGFTYVAKVGDLYKIGCARSDPHSRIRTISSSTGLKLSLRFYLYSQCYRGLEKELHESYQHLRVYGEFFRLSQRDLSAIRRIGYFKGVPVKHYTPIYFYDGYDHSTAKRREFEYFADPEFYYRKTLRLESALSGDEEDRLSKMQLRQLIHHWLDLHLDSGPEVDKTAGRTKPFFSK